jgi:hypothetical protein
MRGGGLAAGAALALKDEKHDLPGEMNLGAEDYLRKPVVNAAHSWRFIAQCTTVSSVPTLDSESSSFFSVRTASDGSRFRPVC